MRGEKVDFELEPVPLSVDLDDVSLYLYTMENEYVPEIITHLNFELLMNSQYYDPSKSNVFIVHGWIGGYDEPAPSQIKNSIIELYDVNVFVVDWSGPAKKLYPTAKRYVPIVGELVADFIKKMYTYYGINGHNIRLIGHSLGAHLCGCIGKNLNGEVEYIIGLDPAGPLYSTSQVNECLNKNDALFVQVIHTNGGLLGFNGQLGDVDYYPNGGKRQNGCGLDLLGGCAHARSFEYLAESITGSQFEALQCDSYNNFKNGNCDNNVRALMGQFHIHKQ